MSASKPIFFASHQPEYSSGLTPLEKCVSGQPEQQTWHHFTSSDERFLVGIWEAEPGRWQVSYREFEYCRILSGHSILHAADGHQYQLRSGDEFVIPAGFEGQWEVVETTRKTYVIYEP